jgi:hypothetical protein
MTCQPLAAFAPLQFSDVEKKKKQRGVEVALALIPTLSLYLGTACCCERSAAEAFIPRLKLEPPAPASWLAAASSGSLPSPATSAALALLDRLGLQQAGSAPRQIGIWSLDRIAWC